MFGIAYSTGSPVFHSYSKNALRLYTYLNGTAFNNLTNILNSRNALQDSCNTLHIVTTCATVKTQADDPTYPITKYTAPKSSLSEFNIAGKVIYTTSCASFNASACLELQATKAPPPLSVQFHLVTKLKALYATIQPMDFTNVYKRITLYGNNTVAVDVTGGNSQTITWSLNTTAQTTINWYGNSPTSVTCTSCSSSYNGYAEVLVIPLGTTDNLIQIQFTGANLNCLCAIAESVNPIGDLSTVVSKEFETSAYFSLTSNPCNGNKNVCDWGWFLTTNSSAWQTNNPTWNPYTDPSIALFSDYYYTTGTRLLVNALYVQQAQGQTLSSEDLGCRAGGSSSYMCTNTGSVSFPAGYANSIDLNYTGGSTGYQVGSASSCPAFGGTGGSSCTYLFNVCISIHVCINPGVVDTSTIFPQLPLAGSTYYIGFFVDASELNSPVYFCYDTSAICSNPQTFTVAGCVTASLEIDSCVPNPITQASPNAVPSVTDSGGFFGSVSRFFGSVGHAIVGAGSAVFAAVSNPLGTLGNALGGLVNDLINAFEQFFSVMATGLVLGLNAVGNFFHLGNVGTNILNFFNSIGAFLINVLSGVFSFFVNGVSYIANGITAIGYFFSSTLILGLWNGFLTSIPTLVTGLNTFLGYLLFFYNAGLFTFNIIVIFALIILALSALIDYEQSSNPIAIFVGIILAFFTFYVMTLPNSAINIVATNPTVLSNYQTAFTNTVFFIKLAPVLFVLMLVNYMAEGTDLSSFSRGSNGFMHNFTTTLHFYQMITVDLAKAGIYIFNLTQSIIVGIKQLVAGWV